MIFRGVPIEEWLVVWREQRREQNYDWAPEALQVIELLNSHFNYVLRTESDSNRAKDTSCLEDKHRELNSEVASLRAEVNILKDRLLKARTYRGLEAWPCPLCTYVNGIHVNTCEMHKQEKKLLDHIESQDTEIHQLVHELDKQNGNSSGS